MNGKDKCKILKEIRNLLAKANGIDFESSECNFEGDCRGYCPKCDKEARFLNYELKQLKRNGEVNYNVLQDLSFLQPNKDIEAKTSLNDGEIFKLTNNDNECILPGVIVDPISSEEARKRDAEFQKMILKTTYNTYENGKTPAEKLYLESKNEAFSLTDNVFDGSTTLMGNIEDVEGVF